MKDKNMKSSMYVFIGIFIIGIILLLLMPNLTENYEDQNLYKDGFETRDSYCDSFKDPYWRYYCFNARHL